MTLKTLVSTLYCTVFSLWNISARRYLLVWEKTLSLLNLTPRLTSMTSVCHVWAFVWRWTALTQSASFRNDLYFDSYLCDTLLGDSITLGQDIFEITMVSRPFAPCKTVLVSLWKPQSHLELCMLERSWRSYWSCQSLLAVTLCMPLHSESDSVSNPHKSQHETHAECRRSVRIFLLQQ